jgi:hypothetical protein
MNVNSECNGCINEYAALKVAYGADWKARDAAFISFVKGERTPAYVLSDHEGNALQVIPLTARIVRRDDGFYDLA